MKKSKFIFLSLMIPSLVPLCACTTMVSQTQLADDPVLNEKIIEDDLLDIENGHLRGFAHGVTIEQIRQEQYTTLQIPNSVRSIDDFAFAYMFDGKSTFVNKIIFNSDLEKIGISSFNYCYGFQGSLDLSKTKVTSIGQDAFYYCTGFSELKLPEGIKTIGNDAFWSCSGLKNTVKFPTSIENVGSYAFNNCGNIYDIDLSNFATMPAWMLESNGIFNNVGSLTSEECTVTIDCSKLDEADWQYAIFDRQNLSSDKFKINILKVSEETDFQYDNPDDKKIITKFIGKPEQLDVIKIPDSVEEIADGAFKDITKGSLKLIFNKGIKKINNNAFSDSTAFNCNLVFPMEESSLETIGENAFKGCKNIIGQVSFPKTVTELGASAFQGTGINSIVIKPWLTKVGELTFGDCTNLTEIVVSDITKVQDVTDFWKGDYGKNKEPLVNVAPKGVLVISDTVDIATNWVGALKRLGMTTQFVSTADRSWMIFNSNRITKPLPQTTADKAFAVRNNNEIVSLSKKYKDDDTFQQKYGLIQIPERIVAISDNAFKDQKQFQSEVKTLDLVNPWYISFNTGLVTIGSSAFENCTGLTGRLTLPKTVTTVGTNAFKGCTYLYGDLSLSSSLKTIGANAFNGTSFSYIKLPKSIISIGEGALQTKCIDTIDLTEYGETYKLNWQSNNALSIQPSNNKGKILVCGDSAIWKTELKKYGLNDYWDVISIERGE